MAIAELTIKTTALVGKAPLARIVITPIVGHANRSE
jgi:hypothetical protein